MIYTRYEFYPPDYLEPRVYPSDPRLVNVYTCEYTDAVYQFDPVDNTIATFDYDRWRWTRPRLYTCQAPAIHTCAPPPVQGPSDVIPF